MPNKRYRKGYKFEIRVKKFLEGIGYKVYRSAGSKPVDLIAISNRDVLVIECKSSRVTKSSIERLAKEVEGLNVRGLIAFRDGVKKIKFLDVMENREVRLTPVSKHIDKPL